MRVAELQAALGGLRDLSASSSTRIPNNIRKDSQIPLDWNLWRGKLETDKDVVMSGHSFGSTTAIEAIKSADLQGVFRSGICLDPVGHYYNNQRAMLMIDGNDSG